MFIECKKINKKIGSFELNIEHLVFEEGKLYIIEGENGCGKSTFLTILSNLMIQDKGTILYDGLTIKGNEKYIKNRMAYLPNIISLPNIYNKVIVSSIFKNQYSNFSNEKFEYYLSIFNINNMKKIKEMSDGMKKKFMLSTLLSYTPEVLILDEPFNDLDVATKKILVDEFVKIINNKGTIIMSTHTKKDLENFNFRTIKMKSGQLV